MASSSTPEPARAGASPISSPSRPRARGEGTPPAAVRAEHAHGVWAPAFALHRSDPTAERSVMTSTGRNLSKVSWTPPQIGPAWFAYVTPIIPTCGLLIGRLMRKLHFALLSIVFIALAMSVYALQAGARCTSG